jgi:hypothetical protein
LLIDQDDFIDRPIDVLVMPETRLDYSGFQPLNSRQFSGRFLKISANPPACLLKYTNA